MEIKVYSGLKGENEKFAAENRKLLEANDTVMINMIGAPGCGKTSLLEASGRSLPLRIEVLEGDVATTNDARRLQEAGIRARQLVTGGACHLEAKLVHRALVEMDLDSLDVVVVENVGNLVCPASFDIGENAKVALLSITEGEDKPLKYPLLFRRAYAVVITKVDLADALGVSPDAYEENVRRVNPDVNVMRVSSRSGEGLASWAKWLAGLKERG